MPGPRLIVGVPIESETRLLPLVCLQLKEEKDRSLAASGQE